MAYLVTTLNVCIVTRLVLGIYILKFHLAKMASTSGSGRVSEQDILSQIDEGSDFEVPNVDESSEDEYQEPSSEDSEAGKQEFWSFLMYQSMDFMLRFSFVLSYGDT